MGSETTLLHLYFPNDELALLDDFAVARREAKRPLTRTEWLTGTPEGRELWAKIQSNRGLLVMRTTEDLNNYVQQEFAKATGGLKTGRPSLNEFRVEVLVEALKEYLSTRKPETPPPRGLQEVLASVRKGGMTHGAE